MHDISQLLEVNAGVLEPLFTWTTHSRTFLTTRSQKEGLIRALTTRSCSRTRVSLSQPTQRLALSALQTQSTPFATTRSGNRAGRPARTCRTATPGQPDGAGQVRATTLHTAELVRPVNSQFSSGLVLECDTFLLATFFLFLTVFSPLQRFSKKWR